VGGTTASANIVIVHSIALSWEEGLSWVLGLVVEASLLLFASLVDLLDTSVDTDFVLTRQ
jgi:hypothetical protein